jgi:hypothetical protein
MTLIRDLPLAVWLGGGLRRSRRAPPLRRSPSAQEPAATAERLDGAVRRFTLTV